MAKFKVPKTIWAYVGDKVDGRDLWFLAESLDEIPIDQSGQKIARYSLDGTFIFAISREVYKD